MAEPTLVAYAESNFTDNVAGNTTGSLTWQSGDILYAIGLTADQSMTMDTPTTAGANMGTFNLVSSPNAASSARAYYWKATASGAGSGTITVNVNAGSNRIGGLAVWQYRDVSAEGTPVLLNASANKTSSVTRGAANSHILQGMVDWEAVNDVVTDPTPATNATEREIVFVTGQCTFFVTSWGDQGATGTTAYGISNHTGTVKMTGVTLEVQGITGGGAAPVGAGLISSLALSARRLVQ